MRERKDECVEAKTCAACMYEDVGRMEEVVFWHACRKDRKVGRGEPGGKCVAQCLR